MEIATAILDKVKRVRRELHNIPEHSGKEEQTRALIQKFLRDNSSLQVISYKGGILALYEYKPGEAAVALRGDFDAVALPDGRAAHLCGHDGHTAALLGVALMLESLKPERNVLLIFQPAEETGEGAKAMTDLFAVYPVQEIYGAHNLPGFELGKVFTTLDTFACASCGLIVTICGKPTHAAYPENGVSPMSVVRELFTAIEQSQKGNCFEPGAFATLIGCNIGQKAFGTAAEKAEVWVTVRARTEVAFAELKNYLETTVRSACEKQQLSYSLELQDEFPATINHKECAEKVLERCGGTLLQEPMRWSEDFGHFLRFKHGAFFGIGAGDCPGLHTESYEYPEELLEHQIKAFFRLL